MNRGDNPSFVVLGDLAGIDIHRRSHLVIEYFGVKIKYIAPFRLLPKNVAVVNAGIHGNSIFVFLQRFTRSWFL